MGCGLARLGLCWWLTRVQFEAVQRLYHKILCFSWDYEGVLMIISSYCPNITQLFIIFPSPSYVCAIVLQTEELRILSKRKFPGCLLSFRLPQRSGVSINYIPVLADSFIMSISKIEPLRYGMRNQLLLLVRKSILNYSAILRFSRNNFHQYIIIHILFIPSYPL